MAWGGGVPRRARTSALVAAVGVLVTVGVSACDQGTESGDQSGRVRVVAGVYPLAWAAEAVGGDAVTVADLTPNGAEAHDLELTPDQRDDVADADLVIVIGAGFQPAVEDSASQRDGETLVVHDALDGTGELDDPHVWLDPLLMGEVVDAIAEVLAEAAPDHAAELENRAAATRDTLTAVDREYESALGQCESRALVTAHDAFGYLAARYDLRNEGVAGLSPDAEPDPARLADLADLVESEGVEVVFTEELVSREIAETLASEAGVETRVLSTLEGLTEDQHADGDDYVSVMRENLTEIRVGLGCA